MRLGVDLKDGEWDLVARLGRQQLVAGAAKDQVVQDRDARAVGVDLDVGVSDQHLLHRRIGGVLVFVGVGRVLATRFIFLCRHVDDVGRSVKVDDLVKVKAHGDQVADAHVGAVSANVAVINGPRVAVNEELFRRDRHDANVAIAGPAHNFDVVGFLDHLGAERLVNHDLLADDFFRVLQHLNVGVHHNCHVLLIA